MLKKSAVALSVATFAMGAALLPAAVAKADSAQSPQQIASGEQTTPKTTTPTGQSNPCAAGSGCHHGSKPQTS